MKVYRGDKWSRAYVGPIPLGAEVQVLRNFPRRRVLVEVTYDQLVAYTCTPQGERDLINLVRAYGWRRVSS